MASFSAAQLQVQSSARRYFDRRTKPRSIVELGADQNLRHSRWREIADLGWLGVAVPGALGGFGGGAEMVALAQEVAAALAVDPILEAGVFPSVFLAHAQPTGARSGLLDELITGTVQVVAASTGPNAPQTDGVRFTTERKSILLFGEIRCVLGAEDADFFLVAASHGDAGQERSVFLIDRQTPRLRCETFLTIDGRNGSNLHFTGVELPHDAIVTGAGDVLNAFDLAQDTAILGQCAELVGLMDRMFDLTREHLLARRQFGQPLANFQALRHRFADMYAELEQARAILSRGVTGLGYSAAQRSWAVSACKLRIGRAARFVGEQAIQLHGAIAMTEDYVLGRYYKRMLVIRKIWGNENFHAMRMMKMRREFL
jgi:alkylation response protein AidB-like acyl-CoA dehydrogenase